MSKKIILPILLILSINFKAYSESAKIHLLAVGNSWSLNATNYVGNILQDLGIDIKIGVCYAGGATLKSYWQNIQSGKEAYEFHIWEDGEWSRPTTLHSYKDILLSDEWDIITHQQQSGASGVYSSYQPYLHDMIEWEKSQMTFQPLFALHATWAYPDIMKSNEFQQNYDSNTTTMYQAVLKAYNTAMQDENIHFVMPCTPMIQQTRELGIPNVDTSDGSHLSTTGFFAAGCIWAEMILKYYLSISTDVTESTYKPSNLSIEEASSIRLLARTIAGEVASYYSCFVYDHLLQIKMPDERKSDYFYDIQGIRTNRKEKKILINNKSKCIFTY